MHLLLFASLTFNDDYVGKVPLLLDVSLTAADELH